MIKRLAGRMRSVSRSVASASYNSEWGVYLGRRVGDWAILAWFAALGAIHLGVWLP